MVVQKVEWSSDAMMTVIVVIEFEEFFRLGDDYAMRTFASGAASAFARGFRALHGVVLQYDDDFTNDVTRVTALVGMER